MYTLGRYQVASKRSMSLDEVIREADNRLHWIAALDVLEWD